MKRNEKNEKKRIEAELRQEDHDKLTVAQKLDKAISRGHFNSREAKRLRSLLGPQKSMMIKVA